MILLYALKITGLMAATAVAELWANGDCWISIAALPMLATMAYATRQYARRRARESGSG